MKVSDLTLILGYSLAGSKFRTITKFHQLNLRRQRRRPSALGHKFGHVLGVGCQQAATALYGSPAIHEAVRKMAKLDWSFHGLTARSRQLAGDKTLVEAGYQVVMMARRAESMSGDVGIWADCERVVNASLQAFGRLDTLVNAAGTWVADAFIEVQPDALRPNKLAYQLKINMNEHLGQIRRKDQALFSNPKQLLVTV